MLFEMLVLEVLLDVTQGAWLGLGLGSMCRFENACRCCRVCVTQMRSTAICMLFATCSEPVASQAHLSNCCNQIMLLQSTVQQGAALNHILELIAFVHIIFLTVAAVPCAAAEYFYTKVQHLNWMLGSVTSNHMLHHNGDCQSLMLLQSTGTPRCSTSTGCWSQYYFVYNI
jgi:hypothetical protein